MRTNPFKPRLVRETRSLSRTKDVPLEMYSPAHIPLPSGFGKDFLSKKDTLQYAPNLLRKRRLSNVSLMSIGSPFLLAEKEDKLDLGSLADFSTLSSTSMHSPGLSALKAEPGSSFNFLQMGSIVNEMEHSENKLFLKGGRRASGLHHVSYSLDFTQLESSEKTLDGSKITNEKTLGKNRLYDSPILGSISSKALSLSRLTTSDQYANSSAKQRMAAFSANMLHSPTILPASVATFDPQMSPASTQVLPCMEEWRAFEDIVDERSEDQGEGVVLRSLERQVSNNSESSSKHSRRREAAPMTRLFGSKASMSGNADGSEEDDDADIRRSTRLRVKAEKGHRVSVRDVDYEPGYSREVGIHPRFRSRRKNATPKERVAGVPTRDSEFLQRQPHFGIKHTGRFGAYSAETRKQILERYLAKRKRRVWKKRIRYSVRKDFADSRLRVKGRFIGKEDEASLLEGLMLAF